MLATLRNRNFSLLWVAGLVSLIGNWILIAALPFHIYAVTGSALATSGWLMAYIVPGILFGSIAGVFVDRWDRRRTMIGASLLQAAVIPLLLLAQSAEWIWVVYLVAFIESSLSQFFSPAENALLPTLVGEEHLISANSLNSLNDNLARLVGPAIGGALLGLVGFGSVIVADAISYLLAAVLILLVHAPTAVTAVAAELAPDSAASQWIKTWREWLAGLKLIVQDQLLSRTFLVMGIALFGDAIFSAVMVVFAQEYVGLNALQFSWVLIARGIGGLIGGLLLGKMGKKVSFAQLITWGLIVVGVVMLAMIRFPSLYVMLPLTGLVGIPSIAWYVSIQTVLQQGTEDAYRGRVFGALGTTISILMLISSGLAGILTDQLGSAILVAAAAGFSILAGIAAGWLLTKPVQNMKTPMLAPAPTPKLQPAD
ncbi:MAG: MFS transporter [Chloroflexi bacterium]|nr:MFS transporter [Chloroflexota bacterium]